METSTPSPMLLGPGEGPALRVLGEFVTFKITSEQTDGAFSLFEIVSPPQGGPPPHRQFAEDEFFYVLDGQYAFLVGDRTVLAGPGTQLYVPQGTLHAYTCVSDRGGRMLVGQTPGGLHERFFREVGQDPAEPETDPPDVARLAEAAARYLIEIAPPPEVSPVGRLEACDS